MATEIMNRIEAQPSLYDPVQRTVDYWFDIPEGGITKDTGIMLFIGGYGATAQSNIFRKMRNMFADKYNMITVQCNYFGFEYMWVPKDIVGDLSKQFLSQEELNTLSGMECEEVLIERIRDRSIRRVVRQKETAASLNDMGPVQAMDNLAVLYSLDRFLSDNGLNYDRNRITAFGNSHGAYLAELCNAYMPGVLSAIIDIGGYVFPNYLHKTQTRKITSNMSELNSEVITLYDDLIKHIVFDTEIYDLNALFTEECEKARIIAFHGENDFLTPPFEKRDYIGRSDNWIFNLITEADVDGDVFTNSEHNLGTDFIKLIEHVIKNYNIRSDEEKMIFGSTVFETDKAIYNIDIYDGRPDLSFRITGEFDRDEMIRIINRRPETELVIEQKS